jgi:drug/metabolite transporter (DMT)-like permease
MAATAAAVAARLRHSPAVAHVLLASVVVFWAGAFAAIKALLDAGVSAQDVAIWRYAVAAPGFALAFRASGGLRALGRADAARLVACGLCVGPGYHLALNVGERFTTSGTASVIVALGPGMTLALALALGLERFSTRRLVGLAVAFLGVLTVILLGSGEEVSLAGAKGPLIVLASPVSFALYNVLAKPLLRRESPIAVSAAASLVGTAALMLVARGSTWSALPSLPLRDGLLVLYLGLACTLAAYLAWTVALRSLDASRTVAYLYGVPPLAVSIGALTLGERVTFWLLAGGALVLVGVALAQLERADRRRE